MSGAVDLQTLERRLLAVLVEFKKGNASAGDFLWPLAHDYMRAVAAQSRADAERMMAP